MSELSFARLARFYQINPAKIPLWAVRILLKSIEPLRYEEAQFQAVAMRAAMSDEKGWQKSMKRLADMAEPYHKKEIAIAANEKARAWFIANGIPIA